MRLAHPNRCPHTPQVPSAASIRAGRSVSEGLNLQEKRRPPALFHMPSEQVSHHAYARARGALLSGSSTGSVGCRRVALAPASAPVLTCRCLFLAVGAVPSSRASDRILLELSAEIAGEAARPSRTISWATKNTRLKHGSPTGGPPALFRTRAFRTQPSNFTALQKMPGTSVLPQNTHSHASSAPARPVRRHRGDSARRQLLFRALETLQQPLLLPAGAARTRGARVDHRFRPHARPGRPLRASSLRVASAWSSATCARQTMNPGALPWSRPAAGHLPRDRCLVLRAAGRRLGRVGLLECAEAAATSEVR